MTTPAEKSLYQRRRELAWGVFIAALMASPARRTDGWPLCPACGEDELYSLSMVPTPMSIEGCYRCGRWLV